jgi:hypothetical protein
MSMIPTISLRRALADNGLLGHAFEGDSWSAWRCLLLAAMGEELTEDERAIFKQFTGREREPGQRVEELVIVKGRRAGGSYSCGKVLIPYLAGLCRHPNLTRGERGILLVVAQDQRTADGILDYAEAAFRASPVLSQLIEARTARELRLTNNIDIEVRAADFRRLRGLTYIAVCADELAFWSSDYSANPDDEILNAVRPGLATTGGPLIMISSPYARKGELWRTYQKDFGAAGDPRVLVAQGSTRDFNPTLPQSVVDRALERDPAAASAEYLAEFRRDIESFVSLEAVRGCVAQAVLERAPQRGHAYQAFADPSGGSADSFTLCVGHYEYSRQTIVIDCLREQSPPFSPEATVEEMAGVLQTHNLRRVTGDAYAGIWPVEQFAKFGVVYEQSARAKSLLYQDLLPLINSRRIELLDAPRMLTQLLSLERRTLRGGRDSIDHPANGHDDLVNAVAGVASVLLSGSRYNLAALADWPPKQRDDLGIDEWRRKRYEQEDAWLARYRQPPPPINVPGMRYFDPTAHDGANK